MYKFNYSVIYEIPCITKSEIWSQVGVQDFLKIVSTPFFFHAFCVCVYVIKNHT